MRLLGSSDDPPLLVLEDLGDGPSVADLLLGSGPTAAERAVIAWAVAVGTLQAASAGLGDEFRMRLTSATDPLRTARGGGLVPGDTCPDNALYMAGRLTLIDFEAAAFVLRQRPAEANLASSSAA